MTGPSGERCGDCYFWDLAVKEDEHGNCIGLCWRYPPTMPMSEQEVDAEYWCGEFKPQPKK